MRGRRVALLLAALARTGIGFGGPPDAIAAQEMPRGVATDLFDAALHDTLDTPPAGRPMSRILFRPGPVVLLVSMCGVLLVLVRRRRWLTGRSEQVGNRPSSAKGAVTSVRELPRGPRNTPRRTKTPIDLRPHVVDFLRRNAQRRREAHARPEPADQPRIDVWIPGYGAGRGDE